MPQVQGGAKLPPSCGLATPSCHSPVEGVELRLGDRVGVGIESDMRHYGVDDPQRHRAALPPPRQITELPPPQGLVEPAALVVGEPVREGGGDLDEVAHPVAVGVRVVPRGAELALAPIGCNDNVNGVATASV